MAQTHSFLRGTLTGAIVGVGVGSLDVCRTLLATELGSGVAGRYVTGVFSQLMLYAAVGVAFAIASRICGAIRARVRRSNRQATPRGEFIEQTVFLTLWMVVLLFGLPPSGHDKLFSVVALSAYCLAFAFLVTRIRSADSALAPAIRIVRAAWFALLAVASASAVFAATQLNLESLSDRATADWKTGPSTARNDHPDIVLITVDTLRADRLSLYGGSTIETPNLDSLAAQSVIFDHMVAQSPWTRASFGSIWTGRTPSVHEASWRILHGEGGKDVPLASFPIKSDLPTLPEILSDAGYLTVGMNNNIQTSARFGFSRGFRTWIDVSQPIQVLADSLLCRTMDAWFLDDGCPLSASRTVDYPYLSADRLTPIVSAVVSKLDNATAPTFLWIHYLDPHVPLNSHDDESDSLNYEEIREELAHDRGSIRKTLGRAYDAEIAFLDNHLGEVLTRIQSLPRLRNAAIVFTSDHGEELGERWRPTDERAPGRYFEYRGDGHGHTLHEELLHVPFLLRLPDRSLAGQRYSSTVHHTDLLPTLAAIAGVATSVPADSRGRDLIDSLGESPPATDTRVLFAEHSLYVPELKQARSDTLKVILRTDGVLRSGIGSRRTTKLAPWRFRPRDRLDHRFKALDGDASGGSVFGRNSGRGRRPRSTVGSARVSRALSE